MHDSLTRQQYDSLPVCMSVCTAPDLVTMHLSGCPLHCSVLYCVCRVLVLGAGYVSAPVVEYLTRDTGLGVTVAAALKSGLEMENTMLSTVLLNNPFAEADKIAMTHERTEPVLLDVNERPDLLDDLIKSHNIVVSLLPWQLHPSIAAR